MCAWHLRAFPGCPARRSSASTSTTPILRLSERALPRLRLRFSDFFPRRRRRLGFAASSFSPLSAHWLGMMECVHEVCGLVRHTQPLAGLWEMARHASWIVPHARVCWLMERPQFIRTDPNGRLHAPDGPALGYADGCKVYAWKGILLPPHLIEQRDRIDVRSIETVTDPHIRRCMIDIMTPQRFIEQRRGLPRGRGRDRASCGGSAGAGRPGRPSRSSTARPSPTAPTSAISCRCRRPCARRARASPGPTASASATTARSCAREAGTAYSAGAGAACGELTADSATSAVRLSANRNAATTA